VKQKPGIHFSVERILGEKNRGGEWKKGDFIV